MLRQFNPALSCTPTPPALVLAPPPAVPGPHHPRLRLWWVFEGWGWRSGLRSRDLWGLRAWAAQAPGALRWLAMAKVLDRALQAHPLTHAQPPAPTCSRALQPPDPGAAAGRHQPHLPRLALRRRQV